MYCQRCGAQNIKEAKYCFKCGSSLLVRKGDTDSKPHKKPNGLRVVEALKTTNTPCLWISLDYWNLYFYEGKAIAVRCHRGWWGLIGFFIGLFLYIVTFLIFSAIGILLDKSRGESKCKLMKDRIDAIMSNRTRYKIIEATRDQIKGPQISDLCLGNIWLKFKIELAGKKFYFENSKYEQIKTLVESL